MAEQQRRSELRLGMPIRSNQHVKFWYVYILEAARGGHFYTGITEGLRARLKAHNAGEVPHTAKRRLWRIKTTVAFTDKARAIDFERYLKTSSGRAFAKKRL